MPLAVLVTTSARLQSTRLASGINFLAIHICIRFLNTVVDYNAWCILFLRRVPPFVVQEEQRW